MNLNFTLILQIVSFLTLLGLLTKFLYKPFIKYLDERAQSIKNMTEGAEKAQEQAKRYAQQTHQALEMAKGEALRIKEETRSLSDTERRRIIEEARKEASSLIEIAKKQLGIERESVLKKIRSDVATISVEIARRLLSKEIREQDHKRLIEESMSEIENELSGS